MKTGWFTRGALVAACLLGSVACSTTSQRTPSQAERADDAATPKVATAPRASLATALEPVYFEHDRWDLRPEARRALKENAQRIQASGSGGTITVEGHCDERGSEEYNLALGDRRAAAVSRYLQDLGVPGARLRTVSFGESRPAATGHDETSWRLNRRSELRFDSRSASR